MRKKSKINNLSHLINRRLIILTTNLLKKWYIARMAIKFFKYDKNWHTILSMLVFLITCQTTLYSTPLSNRTANYQMNIQLDVEKKMLHGKTILKWVNPSNDTIKNIPFHLYYNAFKNTRSTFNKERSGSSFFGKVDVKNNHWGWSEINNIKDDKGNNLTTDLHYIKPDDENAEDKTVLNVPLKEFVLPGDSIEIEFEWTAKIPLKSIRTGYNKDFYFFAQWFPKVGVYETAGTRYATNGQWNCHQYHSSGEYYSDFGLYDVYLTVPQNYVVGASGALQEKTTKAENQTWHFIAEDVIDFTWTTSPHFQIQKTTWKNVEISLFSYPEKMHFSERYFTNIINALTYMDEHVGTYPYSTLTIIDPPIHGIFTGGMEYPTLLTSLSACFLPMGLKFTEALTTHEFIHQYFMQMVATHEVEEPWMDEGFTTYYEMRILDFYEGKHTSAVDFLGVKMGSSEFNRAEYLSTDNPKIAEGNRKSWQYKHGGYGTIAYNKTAMWLKTLDGIIGRNVMDTIMKTYFDRWKFKHPSGQDFIDIVNEIVPTYHQNKLGADMNWFFEQVLYGSGVCDYKIASITNRSVVPKAGIFGADKQWIVPEVEDDQYKSTVVVNRLEEMQFPVEIAIHFDDGSTQMKYWDGKARSMDFQFTGTSKIISAEIDPERKIDLDVNFLNNSYVIEHQGVGIRKYVAQFINSLQQLMQTLSAFI